MHFKATYGELLRDIPDMPSIEIIKLFTIIPVTPKYGKIIEHLDKINKKINYYIHLSLFGMEGEIFDNIKQAYKFISLPDDQINEKFSSEILQIVRNVYFYFHLVANDDTPLYPIAGILFPYSKRTLTSSINFDTIEYTTIQPNIHSLPYDVIREELRNYGFIMKESLEGYNIFYGKTMITKLNKEYMLFNMENDLLCTHILTDFSFSYTDTNVYKLLPIEYFRLNLIYILQIFKLFVLRLKYKINFDGSSIQCNHFIEIKFINSIPSVFILKGLLLRNKPLKTHTKSIK